MSPIGFEIDPSVHFAQLFLCLTILVTFWKLLKYFSRQSEKDVLELTLENESLSGQSPTILVRFFHFLLFLSCPLLIIVNISIDYPFVKQPKNNWDKDLYFGLSFQNMFHLFFYKY
jgi:hypothetical protein